MTPADLLSAARDLVKRPAAANIGGWSRAVAILTRQALEQALDEFWTTKPATAGLCDCSMKTQLICLPAYLEPRLARQISYVWAALSNACHYHPYHLAPTSAELTDWMHAVHDLVVTVGESHPQSPPGTVAADS